MSMSLGTGVWNTNLPGVEAAADMGRWRILKERITDRTINDDEGKKQKQEGKLLESPKLAARKAMGVRVGGRGISRFLFSRNSLLHSCSSIPSETTSIIVKQYNGMCVCVYVGESRCPVLNIVRGMIGK